MHTEVLDFIKRMRLIGEDAFTATSVFEAGSLDINGSPREFFPDAKKYVGVDWRPGKGVDHVGLVHEFNLHGLGISTFDFVVSTEMLEHDPHWEASVGRMMELLAPDGSILLTCAGPGRHPHRLETSPTGTHYKNLTMAELAGAVLAKGSFRKVRIEEDPESHDLRLFGWRKI